MNIRMAVVVLAAVSPSAAWAQSPALELTSAHASLGELQPGSSGRAAGSPLHDGTLPPGMLTVRVVRDSFTDNMVNQTVTVQVAGGKMEQATTGQDGRAQFAHLPVGGSVQASVLIDGAVVQSDLFAMPSDSGVRLLLVTGQGPVTADGHPGDTAPASVPAAGAASASAVANPATLTPPSGDDWSWLTAIRVVMVLTTLVAFVVLGLRRPSRRS